MKFGSVCLVGKSNVGKSTFINQVLKLKLSITSSKVQTTRNTIAGIYNDQDSQIVFYDTPGIYKTMNLMNKEMMKETRRSLKKADLILYFINSYDRINDVDKSIIKMIKESEIDAYLICNKSDLIEDDEDFFTRILEFKNEHEFKGHFAVSSLNGHYISNLIEDIKSRLDEGEPVYDQDLFTNVPTRFICQEYVREKVINLTKEEVPHSITCMVDEFKEGDDLTVIKMSIICDKDSQKPIIIGKNGKMIKEIGVEARKDIEALLQVKVYLELFVKVKEGWRDKENLLTTYGLISKKDE